MKRLVVLAVALAASLSCVSTARVAKGQHPDPRASLPPVLTAAQKKEQQEQQKAASSPTLQLSALDPVIDVRVVFKSGSAADPVGKEGLAQLTARLMRLATVDKDSAAFSDALFPMAAEIGVQVDKDTVVFTGRCHRDHKDAFLRLFTDVLTRPRFDPADFSRLKEEATSALTSTLRAANDERLQREALEVALYDPTVLGGAATSPRHPYGHTPGGTVEGLAAISLDDVKAFAAAAFTGDRAVVGVAGGADDAFVAALTQALATLPKTSTLPQTSITTPALPQTSQLLVIEKPSAGSAISLGFVLPTLSRTHPDYAAMKLAETWFGEHRSLIGHLFDSMREVRGLNYGDYAYVEHFVEEEGTTFEQLNIPRQSQYFSMWIRPVEHKNRLFALRMTAWELQKLVAQGIPDDVEFEKVRSFVMGYWKSKEQEPMRRLGYALDEKLTGMPFDRDGLRDRVAKLTRAEVNAAIARHLHADRVVYVVVTDDAKAMVDDIVNKRPSPMSYASKKSDAVVAEDKVIEGFDLGVGAADIHVVAPGALFQK